MHSIFASVISARGGGHGPSMAALQIIFAIQLDRDIHGRLCIVELHFAADDAPGNHPEFEGVDRVAGPNREEWRHFVRSDAAGL